MNRPPVDIAPKSDGVWNRPSPRRERPSSWCSGRIRVTFFCQDRVEALLVLAIIDQSPGVGNVSVVVTEDMPEVVRLHEERKSDILLAYVKGNEAIPAVRRLHHECPTLPIVLLSDAEDERTAGPAAHAGAPG